MYCPKCSQQQPDDMRYCSRCGFALATVATLLANNGVLSQDTSKTKEVRRFSRSKIATESFLLTLISWAAALGATFWFDAGGPFEIIAKIAAVLFGLLGLIGVGRFLYAFLLVRDKTDDELESAVAATPLREKAPFALPPSQKPDLSDWPRSNTREMVSRPSVTENTTRLLDNDDDSPRN